MEWRYNMIIEVPTTLRLLHLHEYLDLHEPQLYPCLMLLTTKSELRCPAKRP